MASGSVQVTIGYDKKSLRALRKFAKRLDRCVRALADIREQMEGMKLKRMPEDVDKN